MCTRVAALFSILVTMPVSAQLTPAAAWAAAAPARHRAQSNLTYLRVNGEDLKLDIFSRRDEPGPHPTLMYFHGGGWVSGYKDDGLMYTLAWLEMGWNVVNVEYMLSKPAPAPGAVENCLCALRWVAEHAAEYRVDPSRIVVMGDSSGGHLALMTGMAPSTAGLDRPCNPSGDAPLPKVAAIVNWYGITDLTVLMNGPDAKSFATQWIPRGAGRDEMAQKVSPVTWVRPGLPPIVSIHGEADPTVPFSQAVRLREKLESVRAPNLFIPIPGGKHGGFSAEERIRTYIAIRQFLARHGLPTAIAGQR
jgi:acetyl esterase/lipase